MHPSALHTKRLLLNAVRSDDAERIALYCSDPELQRYVPVPVPYTRVDADDFALNYARAAAEATGCSGRSDGRRNPTSSASSN